MSELAVEPWNDTVVNDNVSSVVTYALQVSATPVNISSTLEAGARTWVMVNHRWTMKKKEGELLFFFSMYNHKKWRQNKEK